MTPVKAIRTKCLDCCAGQAAEVRLCPCTSCSLYPFRLGKNPNYSTNSEKGTSLPKNTEVSNDF